MNHKLICRVMGVILVLECLCMLVPLAVSLLYREQQMAASFAISAVICGILGLLLNCMDLQENDKMQVREGFLAVAFSWIVMSVFGALPYLLIGYFPSVVDALFESFSGFTTTGATLVGNLEALPKGLLFWRSLTQWLGGMGVLVLTLALLPKLGAGSVYLLRAESPGPIKTKLVPKIGESAKILYYIYIILTVAETFCLRIAGMPWYDSIVHAMATVATGGFSSRTASLGAYDSLAVNVIVVVFMLLSSLNFSVLYFTFVKRSMRLSDNGEIKIYFRMLAVAMVLISADLILHSDLGSWESIGHAVFQVISVSSTTAFVTTDFSQWPAFSQMILLILMAVGGCAASTAGGIKMQRVALLFRIMYRHLNSLIHPRVVRTICVDGRRVEESVLNMVSLYFFSYIVIIIFLAVACAMDGHTLGTSLSAAIACVSNTGTGIELAGPSSTFNVFSAPSKLILCFGMVAGRLEIMPILLMLFPAVWTGK